MSLMASFVLSFFPLGVLDEIWDLIESVSEGFLTYSCFTVNTYQVDIICNSLSPFFICFSIVGSRGEKTRLRGPINKFEN